MTQKAVSFAANTYPSRGPQGPTGPAGPVGPTGPSGPTGATGPSAGDVSFATGGSLSLTTAFQDLVPTVNVTTAAGDKIVIDASALYASGSLSADTITYRILIDGATALVTDVLALGLTGGGTLPYARSYVASGLSAGAHTIDFQAETSSTTGGPTSSNNALRVIRARA